MRNRNTLRDIKTLARLHGHNKEGITGFEFIEDKPEGTPYDVDVIRAAGFRCKVIADIFVQLEDPEAYELYLKQKIIDVEVEDKPTLLLPHIKSDDDTN